MPQGAAEAEPSTTGKGKRSLGSFFKSKAVPPPSSSTTQLEDAIKAKLDNYLMTPTIDGEEDPLAWWRVHNVNFPWLSKLARKFLCIPATSSPSERLFSASGNVVTCQRSCLQPSKVDMLVFLTKSDVEMSGKRVLLFITFEILFVLHFTLTCGVSLCSKKIFAIFAV